MSYIKLLNNLGFDSDPFDKTNADEEERLSQYFIEPPFFKAVYGDPTSPKSSIVFAPRGGGKTALKRKVEICSIDSPILCITYNDFYTVGYKLDDIDLKYHVSNIVKLVLVGVITAAYQSGVATLTRDERHLLYLFTKEYFSKINQTELRNAINSVQNFTDTAKEWWNKFTGPIGIAINAFLLHLGMDKAEIKRFSTANGNLGTLTDQLRILQKLACKMGYTSIYVLIDKVDEDPLTGKASNSYQFISPLLSNLNLLELNGYGFKFFLWDALINDYRVVARPDRVKYHQLLWDRAQLKDMLSRRLQAYSNEAVTSFDQICETSSGGIDDLIILFSQGSPRNIIRLCKEIIDQQSEINSDTNNISLQAIIKGFEVFSNNYTHECVHDAIIRELQKTKRADFTIKYIYNDVFKFTQQAGVSKITTWKDTGIVTQIGTVQETKGAKSSNHYGITNIIVAKHIFSDQTIFQFIENKVRICPQCSEILIREWNTGSSYSCHNCQHQVNA